MTWTRKLTMAALGIGVFAGAMCWSGDVSQSEHGTLSSQANARVGRPLTPVSYAGVARRTTRRAVAACAPVYDYYGRLIRAC
jgi:hypothetical protein